MDKTKILKCLLFLTRVELEKKYVYHDKMTKKLICLFWALSWSGGEPPQNSQSQACASHKFEVKINIICIVSGPQIETLTR